MSPKSGFRYSGVGWFVTILVAGAITVAVHGYAKVFSPSDYTATLGRFYTMKIEGGYLAKYWWPESDDPEAWISSGKQAGFNVVQMPKAGIAYFDPGVPQGVVNKIVSDFEKDHDVSYSLHELWTFQVSKRTSWFRLPGLIATAMLAAFILIRSLTHFQFFSILLRDRTQRL